MKLEAPALLKSDGKKNIHVSPTGELLSSSASTITTFDAKSPFGCARKFWFQDVAGLVGGGSEAMDLGTAVHSQIEHYLKTGQDALGKEARAGKGNIDEIVKKFPVFQIESWINGLKLDGVNIKGKIDLKGRVPGDSLIHGIVDWKTSSSIERYGKTPYQLRKDPQMLIYRQAAEEEGCIENLPMFHVYFGTQKRESEIVQTIINRQQLAEGLGDTIITLRAMKDAAKVLDVSEVKPDRKKCNEGKSYQCPYFAVCPSNTAVQGASLMASLMDRFKKAVTPDAATPIATVIPVTPPGQSVLVKEDRKLVIKDLSTPEDPAVAAMRAEIAALKGKQMAENVAVISGVLPPDAPKSDPKLASNPVPDFEPIPRSLKETPPAAPEQHNADSMPTLPINPPAKKGGRPPGSKNKVPTTVLAGEVKVALESPTMTEGLDFEVIECTLSHGATVKADKDPKSFEFLRVDISMKATVRRGVDVQTARKGLSDLCQEALVMELEKLRGE